jgi:teichuronic acid biosynthesis glycosyltransferase TuaC
MVENNLLIICNNYPNRDNSYVAEIFVKEQVKYLRNYFDNVFVVSPVAYGMERVRKTHHQNYEYDNVKVFFPKYFNFPLSHAYGRMIWISLEARAIRSLIKRENLIFNLIHAHFTWPSGAVAVELKKTFNVPTIISEGTSGSLYKALKQKDPYYLSTYQQCDAIIRNNKIDIPLFLEAGISKKKIHYVEYGYDPKKFFPIPRDVARNRLGIEQQKKIILNISRLSEEKGQKYLIDAIEILVKKYPEVICYIGGTGPLKETLQKQITISHLDNYVKLIGFVPDDRMVLWVNATDLFVLPSLSEGNPTIMFECLGCGVPFIGTRVGGIPEIIVSEDYGLVVERCNAGDMAKKMLMALEREWDRGRILAYAELFSSKSLVKKILAIYQGIQTETE